MSVSSSYPPSSMAIKLASIVVHAEELLGSLRVHDNLAAAADGSALHGLLVDPEIREFLDGFDPALLPVKR